MISLKELREQNGFTLKELAAKLNCNKQTYWNYEKGIRKVPLDKAVLLAKVFNISTEEIYFSLFSNQNVN